MRRYTLDITGREFVVDVQELAADRFEVLVGGEAYEVTLSGDENLAETSITPAITNGNGNGNGPSPAVIAPRIVPRVASQAPAESSTAPLPRRAPSGAASKATLTAPMPGMILEVSVKAGDTVVRGQQVAILDAMKMHNMIGATRDGIIAEVFVTAGQSVDHGDSIVAFKMD